MDNCHLERNRPLQYATTQANQGSNILHQQVSMYTHVSPVFSPPYTGASVESSSNEHSHLMRSKSLNDISDDSQIQPFIPGRSSHFQHNQFNNNIVDETTNMNGRNITDGSNTNSSCRPNICMPNLGDINPLQITYNQQCTRNFESKESNIINANNITSNQYVDWNTNICGYQCINDIPITTSMPISTNNSTANIATTSSSLFTICNPLALNLNGVTEQIGNLHL